MEYSEEYTDFNIICLDGIVPTHRFILTKVPFWKYLFDNEPASRSVSVPFSVNGVKEAIQFIYNYNKTERIVKYAESLYFCDFINYKVEWITPDPEFDMSQVDDLYMFLMRSDMYFNKYWIYKLKPKYFKDDNFALFHKYSRLGDLMLNYKWSTEELFDFIFDYLSSYPETSQLDWYVIKKLRELEIPNKYIELCKKYNILN